MQPVAHRDPALFRRGMSPASKCLIGLSLSAALVALDGRAAWSERLRSALEGALAPVMLALQMPLEAAREAGRGLSTHGDLLRQIAALQADNDRLRTLSRDLEWLQRENAELRSLAGLASDELRVQRVVELLQSGRGLSSQRFLITAGARQGVHAGMALVNPAGVVGQVIAASENISEVAMLTDLGQNTPVQVTRTGARAVLVGEGVPQRTSLRFLASNADIEPGDLLVTSGLDGVYPAGMSVATVLTVERDAQSEFARVVCKPTAPVDSGRYFSVVAPRVPGVEPDRAPAHTPLISP